MTYLLVAFLVLTLFPLFAASWRVSLLGLSFQGLLLGWVLLRTHDPWSASTLLGLADVALLRGIIAPRVLYAVLSSEHVPRRNDVIPSNLFSWGMVSVLVFLSFRFAGGVVGADLSSSLSLATSTAALLLGLYVLATQNSMFSQMVGLLRIENAIALWELMSPHHFELPIQVGIGSTFLITVLVFGRFLRAELQTATDPMAAERQRHSL